MFPYGTSPSGEDFLRQTRKNAQGILDVFPSGLTKYDAKKTAANVLL